MAAGGYSDHGPSQFYISGTRKCLALTMHAILTVTVTQCDPVLWLIKKNVLPLCPSVLPCIVRCFFKSSNENCGILHNFPSVNFMQSTDNKHSISHCEKRVAHFLILFSEEEQGRNTSGRRELRAQHEHGAGLQHLACETSSVQP